MMNFLNVRSSLGSHLDYIYPMDWSGQIPNLVRQRIQWTFPFVAHTVKVCPHHFVPDRHRTLPPKTGRPSRTPRLKKR